MSTKTAPRKTVTECPRCEGTGSVMVRATHGRQREDTRGYEEVVCPDCMGLGTQTEYKED